MRKATLANYGNGRMENGGEVEKQIYCEILPKIIPMINVETEQKDQRRGARADNEHNGSVGSSVVELHNYFGSGFKRQCKRSKTQRITTEKRESHFNEKGRFFIERSELSGRLLTDLHGKPSECECTSVHITTEEASLGGSRSRIRGPESKRPLSGNIPSLWARSKHVFCTASRQRSAESMKASR